MSKPFLYYVDFIDNPQTNEQRLQNAESIRGMLLGNGPTMTIYAITAIVNAAYITSQIDPAAITSRWLYYIVGETSFFLETQGLWQVIAYDSEHPTPLVDAVTQCDSLNETLITGTGYVARDDNHTTLNQFLNSGYNANLGLVFVKNYTCRHDIPPYFINTAWLDSCRANYHQLLQYFQTHSPKISPVAIAVFAKKKKKRWWK